MKNEEKPNPGFAHSTGLPSVSEKWALKRPKVRAPQRTIHFISARPDGARERDGVGSIGTVENSPSFQRRVATARNDVSPMGTAGVLSGSTVPPGLVPSSRDPGVKTPGYFRDVPAGLRNGGNGQASPQRNGDRGPGQYSCVSILAEANRTGGEGEVLSPGKQVREDNHQTKPYVFES